MKRGTVPGRGHVTPQPITCATQPAPERCSEVLAAPGAAPGAAAVREGESPSPAKAMAQKPDALVVDHVSTCMGCGEKYAEAAWSKLVLSERIEPWEVRRNLRDWSDRFCIEVRVCAGCRHRLVAKRPKNSVDR